MSGGVRSHNKQWLAWHGQSTHGQSTTDTIIWFLDGHSKWEPKIVQRGIKVPGNQMVIWNKWHLNIEKMFVKYSNESLVRIAESHCMFHYFKLNSIFRQIDLFEDTHAQQINKLAKFKHLIFCKFNIQF